MKSGQDLLCIKILRVQNWIHYFFLPAPLRWDLPCSALQWREEICAFWCHYLLSLFLLLDKFYLKLLISTLFIKHKSLSFVRGYLVFACFYMLCCLYAIFLYSLIKLHNAFKKKFVRQPIFTIFLSLQKSISINLLKKNFIVIKKYVITEQAIKIEPRGWRYMTK
jgi:hypothetical protein